ncbi:hypothetical protein [Spiroplasma endosymbiont of Melieria omissa]|uniref:hypothetical protein n=1 Tax=Spiroplasma endosymbiont of Melieria omissa TaxID=3139324 RepID=UPI003CCACF07
MRNKANELADCDKVMDKIKALDVIYEQIVLDTILNSPKFIFNQTYGNVQSTLEQAVRELVTKNYLFKSSGDNNEQNENINMTSSNFKGKNLTDIYDWNVNEIFKRCGIHIPSQKKSAQQSVPESTAVNISTINYIEQKLWQFNIDILKFIQILVRLDKDLLKLIAFNKFNVWLGIATKLKNKFIKRNKKLINCKVYFLFILLLIPKKKLKIKK